MNLPWGADASRAPTEPLLLLLLLPFWCVEVVTWPFVVIAVRPSCACLLVKKNMLVKQRKLQKINLPGPQDADTSRALAAVAAASMCWGGEMAVRRHCHLYFVRCSLLVKKQNNVSRAKKKLKSMNLHGGLETLLLLLLPPFRGVEVVTWLFVVIAVCTSSHVVYVKLKKS